MNKKGTAGEERHRKETKGRETEIKKRKEETQNGREK